MPPKCPQCGNTSCRGVLLNRFECDYFNCSNFVPIVIDGRECGYVEGVVTKSVEFEKWLAGWFKEVWAAIPQKEEE